jgi:hypothetical protein
MKLWHLNVSPEFHQNLADEQTFLRSNYTILSHNYIWQRLIMNIFTDLDGRDGSVKKIIDL